MVHTPSPCHQQISGECQGSGAGCASGCRCCPIPSTPTHLGLCLGCASSPRAAQAAPIHNIQEGSGQGSCSLSAQPQLPRASTVSPWCPWQAPSVPKSSAHTPTEVAPWGGTGRRVPSATGGGLGIRGGTGVCRCRAPAAYACGKAQLQQAQDGIQESAATSCRCPSRRLEPAGSGPRGGRSWPAAGLGGCASQPRREMGYNQSWKRFPAEL